LVTTATPLAPDIYTYRFSIDGAMVLDPLNRDSFNGSSRLSVPGVPWTTDSPDIPRGTLATYRYESKLMAGTEEYIVYTPPGYDRNRRQPYPVFVVLHGLGGQANDWTGQGGVDRTLDGLIAHGTAVPMILVSPHAQGSGNAAAGFPAFTQALLTEILPQVQRAYNASTSRLDRAITGLSMGAAQSLLLLNHLDEFAWIGSFSPGFDMYDPGWGTGRGGGGAGGRAAAPPAPSAPAAPAAATPSVAPALTGAGRGAGNGPAGSGGVRQRAPLADGILATLFPTLDARANSQLKLLYISCGTADDHLDLTRQFKAFLDARKVHVSTYLEQPNAAHVWTFWRPQFVEMAQMVFKTTK